jgi:hypothetical protein
MQRFLQMIVAYGEMKTTSGVKVCMVFGVYSTFERGKGGAPTFIPRRFELYRLGPRCDGTYSPDASRQTKRKEMRKIIAN